MNDNVCCRLSHQMYNRKLKDVNLSLNGCKTFNWKTDVLCFFKMKTWRVQHDFEKVFFSISNLVRCKSFKSKSDAFWKFQFKIMLFRKAPKMQNKSFSRNKRNQNVIFWMQTFFQNPTCPNFFKSKSNALYFFQSKIWRFVKILIKIWRVLKFLFENLTR